MAFGRTLFCLYSQKNMNMEPLTKVTREEALRLLGGVKCPHCSEETRIYIPPLDNLTDVFPGFFPPPNTATTDCIAFNEQLNSILKRYEDGHLTEDEIKKWADEYRQ